jgi:hypothetical protein
MTAAGRLPALRDAVWAYLGLAVLWTFAVAQPLFDLLKDNPEFFAARGSSGFDIISWSVLLVVLPPLLLLAVELLVGLAGEPFRRIAHLVLIAGLVALIAAQALKKSIESSDAVLIVLSVAIALAVAALYAVADPVRSFLRVLSPVPLIFLALFLFTNPISKLAFPDEAHARTIGGVNDAPIVVVLLDELPSNTLVDQNDKLDTKRYPGFAELAKNATWFRNAYTVYDSTERAQPAIMDGNLPARDKQPISSDHPNSIFTIFAKSHRVNADEEATAVCPRDICKHTFGEEAYPKRMSSMAEDLGLVWLHVVSPPDIENDLTSVSENWGNFGGGDQTEIQTPSSGSAVNTRANLNRGRAARFKEWMDRIVPGHRPALNFKHTLMPHVPWQYLPDSKQYRRTARDPIPGLSQESYKDPYQIDSLHQRHLLQTGFADYELGELFRRLKQQGLFDKSLIAVAADHGVAFDLGKRDRRTLTRANAEEIGPIPFFLKAPGQKKGRIDTTFAESVDILPTIFDVLNVNPKVRLDGHSAYSKVDRNRNRIRIFQRNTFKPIRFAIPEWQQRRKAVLDRKLSIFGDGSEGALRLFRIGPHQDLLFRRVSDLSVTPGSGTSVSFPQAGEFRHVDLRTPTVPVHVTGYLKGVPVGRDLAIAVNGRIAATPRSYHLATNNSSIFAAMVPEPYLHQGANRIDVYEITGPGTLRRVGGL